MKKLNGFQIKLFALIFMLLDHINTFFGYELGLPRWVSFLGRFVAPVFLFMMMEGYIHTSNRKNTYLGYFGEQSLCMGSI